MAKQRKQRTGLAEAKNALRPFFGKQKPAPRWKQFNTIRKNIQIADLGDLFNLTESSKSYPFDGLDEAEDSRHVKLAEFVFPLGREPINGIPLAARF